MTIIVTGGAGFIGSNFIFFRFHVSMNLCFQISRNLPQLIMTHSLDLLPFRIYF